jgi:hypothetical protein
MNESFAGKINGYTSRNFIIRTLLMKKKKENVAIPKPPTIYRNSDMLKASF